jgi:membrane protein implicated in regulation of membrane protease activity
MAFGWAVAYLMFSLLSALGGFYLFALAMVGVSVALFVIGTRVYGRDEQPEKNAQQSKIA